MSIALTDFARARLFRGQRRNTIQDITPDRFEQHLNEATPLTVLDGYAPFCKLHGFEGVEPPVADYLVVILYSREQLAKEGTAIAADWGVVGCMYTAEPVETPMAPITMLRNALGVEEGGSGVPIDREAYRCAVEFWRTHANWRG